MHNYAIYVHFLYTWYWVHPGNGEKNIYAKITNISLQHSQNRFSQKITSKTPNLSKHHQNFCGKKRNKPWKITENSPSLDQWIPWQTPPPWAPRLWRRRSTAPPATAAAVRGAGDGRRPSPAPGTAPRAPAGNVAGTNRWAPGWMPGRDPWKVMKHGKIL